MERARVCGFSFIRNGLKYDYPFVEAIRSVLPLVEEFVLAVGNSEDETLEIARSISPKVRIIQTAWEDLREGGRVLALETDKAFQAIDDQYDWCIYVQGDEVFHEEDHPVITSALESWKNDTAIQGFLFKYRHFYGSYDYVATSYKWYRKEVRIVRNDKNIFSYSDAQGFRIKPNNKLKVKEIDATVYHYGWVKPPKVMQDKLLSFNKLWHSDQWVERNIVNDEEFDYSNIDTLIPFQGTHPKAISERIQKRNWDFKYDLSKNSSSLKDKIRKWFEKKWDWIPGEYKNYKKV